MSERQKFLHFHEIYTNCYFWRTKQQQEIDYLEERDGQLWACEFKWSVKNKSGSLSRFSKTFLNAYPDSITQVVTPENYTEWLSADTQQE